MTSYLRTTILGALLIFVSGLAFAAPRPTATSHKAPYGLLTHLPASVARLLPKPAPKVNPAQVSVAGKTVQWTGTVNTDWSNPGNWTTVSGTPNLPPQKGSITGDHVIIPNVSAGSGNFPVVISGSVGARSITLQAGASLTVNAGATLEVVGSDTDGFVNTGIFTNKGTTLVDSSYNDAFVNQLNAQLVNQGSLTLIRGLGNRLINYSSITNTSGTFTVDEGIDTAFINYPTGSVLNNANFNVYGGENVRVYNRGSITNKSNFNVGGATAGNGFINGKTATLTNEASFQINGGIGSQLLNYGIVENLAGNMQINGGAGANLDLVHNTRRLFNKVGASIDLSGGHGTALRNDSIFINEGTFTAQGGAGANPLVINSAGDTIRNKGPFNISGGQGHSLLNYGIFENLANTLKINGGGNNSDQLHNKYRVFNASGAVIDIRGGAGHSLRNDSIIINNGAITIAGGGFEPSIFNGVGDTILTKGDFTSNGGGSFTLDPTRVALNNLGYIEFHRNFQISSRYNKIIRNAGELIGKTSSSSFRVNNSGDIQLYNTAGGKVILEGASAFQNGGKSGILNEGYFKQLTGSFQINNFSWAAITNRGYMELQVNISTSSALDSFLVNRDTLIFRPSMMVNMLGMRTFMYNTGYFLNQANLLVQNIGVDVIKNQGTFVHDTGARLYGTKLVQSSASIKNLTGAKFFNKGDIWLDSGGGVAVGNDGNWNNTGRIKVVNFNGFTSYNAIVNTDTLINEGIIDLDTLNNEGIHNSKYLRNSDSGKIYADYVRLNGIYNTGSVYNFGEIWLAKVRGIGQAGIYSNKLFDNCGSINIGETGPIFGGGIVNAGAGVFNNRPTSHIVINHVDSLSIKNTGTAFNNGLCALIEVATPIGDVSNSFSNHGIIVQGKDTLGLDADITTNTGTVYDLDPQNFVITTNTGQVLTTLPGGGVAPSTISFVTAAPAICTGDTAKFIVEASCPAGAFDLVISYEGIDVLIEDYTSGDTIKLADLPRGTYDFTLKSIDVDGTGQVEKDLPAVQVSIGCTDVKIYDPCTCVNNAPVIPNGTTTNAGTFSETITVEGSDSGETWFVVSVNGLYSDSGGTIPYTTGQTLTETVPGTYELFGYHRDGVGYTISVSNGVDTLEIGNTCYYPDPVFTGLPVLVSPQAATFNVTGTVANNAAGTGTFILDGNTQAGASPAPTVLTINPKNLSLGTHTLVYSFDAGAPGAADPNDPGCVQQVSQDFRVANCGCQNVTISLDANCQFVLTANLVSDGNCGGGIVRVMDNNPGNGNIIDCAGVWTYGLFDSFGNILCWGKVTAEDKTAPALVCAPPNFTLDCYDVNYVLNNRLTIGNVKTTSSPRPSATSSQTILNAEGVAGTGDNCSLGLIPPGLVADNILNLGYAYFKDNCYNCGCRVTLKWSDKVVFYSCEQTRTNGGYYAKIDRQWVATDCNGMSSSYVQSIFFVRPDLDDFVFNGPGEGKYDRVVTYNSCTADKSLIKKEDVTPYVCSYFNTTANPRCLFIDQVECNYSVSIKDTEFPICGGKGVKIDREIYIFDWCAGGIVDTFHVLIKIGDFEAPTVEYAHGAPYDISTGPMDCTASIPVTIAGIKSTFGVTITDNCALGNLSVSVYTKDRYVKGILVYEGSADPFCEFARKGGELRGDHDAYQLGACDKDEICWDKVDYAVMNGMMIGLPIGRHLMVIEAFDGCYNTSTTCFIFDVKDKIAPVMKCDDDLHVTLSNANGYTSGYAQVSVDDIDEGSWDNCKLAWLAARRNVPDACVASFIAKGYDTNGNGKLDALGADNDYSKADGFDLNGDGDISDFGETFILKGGKLMTPLADFVEFFCCDLTERVTVELWGEDIYGNTNYCWMDLLIEDKVAPTCIAPWDQTIYCDDKNIAQIDDKIASSKIFGDITIPSGNDCAALDTVYSTVKSLKCGYGYIDRIWTLTKQTVKGPISITCKQRINILPVHEYNICFPKDVSTDCKTPVIDTVLTDELACDILAVNVSDKRYDASDDECYKIFRTYTVINWCVYDDRCGDPMAEGHVYVVDRATFGNYGKNPLYVLVRDREGNVRDGNEEFYLSKDLIPANADDIRFTPPSCNPESPKFTENGLIPIPAGEYYHSFMYTQIIKVYDDTRPVVAGIRDTFCIRDGVDCLANIKMVVTATDNCTDLVTLETQYLMIAPFQTTDAGKMILYSTPRWSTKDLGNGQFEINVANLPEGTHDLIVVVRDECGNLSVATRIPFTVKDCKGPAPICINGLSAELMSDGNGGGMMAVWATDFIASKIYDCNGQGPETKDGLKLVTKYSINRLGQPVIATQTSINLNCADRNRLVVVEIHAWDNAGNHDFCLTYVEVQDKRSVCPGSSTETVNIAGTIATEGNANLQGASVTLSGAASQSATTPATGGYSFVNLAKGGDFTVTPQLDKNHLNGVSTFDLVLIQKHILGVQALNSPYKMIAADVNNSKSISTLDMIQLRKLILNIDTHFANNTSWRFVDASYHFPNATNPWSAAFPEVVSVNDIANNATANFIAIKVGDVNASATVSSAASAEIRTSGHFELQTQEQQLKAGNEYKVTFTAEDLKNIQGYQFALNLDQSKVELLDLEYGVAKAEHFGIFKTEGLITTSWNAKYEPGALFTLVLRAKADGKLSQSLSLNRLVHPEAYDQNSENLGIKLAFDGEQISDSYELKQNTPNPFGGETNIGFTLPKAMKATLTVRDVKGALIYKVAGNYTKGHNQVTLKKDQLGASGVLYYTLETNDFTATKKMIILQ